MIQVFRKISVEIDLEGPVTIEIPFTVELLQRVEETIHKTDGSSWLRLSKREKSVLEAYEWFAKPYLPGLDLSKVQPTFTALFFSRVRDALVRSIRECVREMNSMDESSEPTETKKAEEAPPSA